MDAEPLLQVEQMIRQKDEAGDGGVDAGARRHTPSHKSPLFLGLLLLLVIALRLLTLGAYPLIDSTEGRYAEIAREMVVTGNWIVPHLDPDLPFWGKPPLSFWAKAVSFEVFGTTEFAARFPAFLFSLLSLAAVFALARRAYGAAAALRACLILSTCGLFFAMKAGVLTDPALLFTVTMTLAAFGHYFVLRRFDAVSGYLMFAGLGLGLLAKGLVGIIIPGVTMFLWVLVYRDWASLRRLPWLGGMALFLVIGVPWHLLAEAQTPGFLEYYIVGEHFLRFVDSGWAGDLYGNPHEEPKGMIWLFALVAAMPWSLIVVYNVIRRRLPLRIAMGDRVLVYSALWFLSSALFFTLSDNIIITYVLPALPGFAIMAERILAVTMSRRGRPSPETFPSRRRLPRLRPAAVPYIALAVALLANAGVLLLLPSLAANRSQRDLVEVFEACRTTPDANLIYYNKFPHSGDFYAGGAAFSIPREGLDLLLERLDDHHEDFFVVDDDDLDRFPISNIRVEKIVTINDSTLFRERRL